MRRGPRVVLLAACALAAGCCGSPSSSKGLVGSVSRGSVNLQPGDTSNSNASTSHIPANFVTVSFNDPAMGIVALYVAGFEYVGGDSYTKHWDLVIGLDGEPVGGMVYQVGATDLNAPGLASMHYFDEVGTWTASAGTITVTSVVGARVRFEVDVTMVAADPGTPGTRYSMGTFTMSGFVTINNINAVCDCLG